MKAGGWPSILVAYVFGVLAVASLVVMVPLQGDFVQRLGMSVGEYGVLIGLIGIPAAALATISGSLVDRLGPRTMLIASALICAVPNFLYSVLPDGALFLPLRLIEGVSLSITLAAGPAFIMRTTSGKRQVTAMTFWSTATPAAISIGMLVGGSFAGTESWRGAFQLYAAALVAAALVGLLLPRLERVQQGSLALSAHLQALVAGYRQAGAVKLGLLLFLVASTSLGLNTILPAYLSDTHSISITAASGLIAGANLAMMAGAVLLGILMARGIAPRHLFAAFMVGAIAFAGAILWPGTPIGAVALVFAGWSLMVGASQGIVFAVLPRIADPAAPGLATGVINQLSTLASFVAPMAFLAVLPQGWQLVVLMIALAWLVSLTMLCTLRELYKPEPAGS